MSKKLMLRRKWLNPSSHEDTGHIKAFVSLDTWPVDGVPCHDIEAGFDLADCARKVSLDFGCKTEVGALARIKKLNILIDTLTEMRDTIDNNKEKLYGS